MGLFASRNGRDTNGDGYVSPFDTEETKDYVDPSKVLDSDNTSSATSESRGNPRWTPQETNASNATATTTTPDMPTASNPMQATTEPTIGRQRPQTAGGSDTFNTAQSRSTFSSAYNAPSTTYNRNSASKNSGQSPASKEIRQVSALASPAIICATLAFFVDFSPALKLTLSVIAAILAVAALVSIKRHKMGGKGRSIAALVVAVCLTVLSIPEIIAMTYIGGNPWTGDWYAGRDKWTSSHSSGEDEEPDYTKVKPEDVEPTVLEDEGSLAWSENSSGDFAIVSARRGPQSHNDKPTVIVTYRFTNHAEKNTSFGIIRNNVYQHGASLRETTVSDYRNYSADNPDGLDNYDYRSTGLEIMTGASLDVTQAYELHDESDIAVELSGNAPTIIRSGFSFVQGQDDLVHLESSDVAGALKPDEEAQAPDTTQWFETWYGYQPDDGVEDSLSFKVRNVAYAGKNNQGAETAIVTIDWKNTSKHPLYFSQVGYPKFFQNGVELSMTSPADNDLYDSFSQIQSLQPDVTGTAMFACELKSVTDQIRMQFAGSNGPKFDQSFAIDGVPQAESTEPSSSASGSNEPTTNR